MDCHEFDRKIAHFANEYREIDGSLYGHVVVLQKNNGCAYRHSRRSRRFRSKQIV